MKKVFLSFIVLLLFTSSCFAQDVDLTKSGQYQKKVMEIGFKILNANRIEKRVVFNYQTSRTVNAYAFSLDHSVTILGGIIPYLDDDDEIAGIISHEIGHNVDYYAGYFRRLAMTFLPKKYEEKADKAAVDYMVKAGYNPLAMITALNKIAGEYSRWCSSSHPVTSKRLAYMYEYIYEKYPAYLVQNDYRENIYYQNFLLTSKKDREKIRQKHELNVSDKHSK
jgi:predicted Zn-dependent protease